MVDKSCLFAREPKWREHRCGMQYELPPRIQSWIYEAGSLTQRLRQSFGPGVAVTVLSQHWYAPFLSESRHLGLPAYRFSLNREVLLHINRRPLLLARTVIPVQTIKVAHRNLAHLGNRPLGEVIFSYPDLERITMDLALVQPESWRSLIQSDTNITCPVWGRRTMYAIQQRPMLVSEFFLDAALVC